MWLDMRPLPAGEEDPTCHLWTYGDRLRDRLRLRGLASLMGVLPGDRLLSAGLAG